MSRFRLILAAAFLFLANGYQAASADDTASFLSVNPAGPTVSVAYGNRTTLTGSVVGTDYTATFNVSSKPLCIVRGARVSSCAYDTNSSTVAIAYRFTDNLVPEAAGTIFDFAFPANTDPKLGETVDMRGGYVSTNVLFLSYYPPTSASPLFGYELDGPDEGGGSAYLDMFVPTSLLDSLGAFYGTTYTLDQLAGLASLSPQTDATIVPTDGGAAVHIPFAFEGGRLVKQVTVGRRPSTPILRASKSSVTAGSKVTLSGSVPACNGGSVYLSTVSKRSVSTFKVVQLKNCAYSAKTKVSAKTAFRASYYGLVSKLVTVRTR